MTVLLWILVIYLYIFIGAFLAGIVTDTTVDDPSDKALITLFWGFIPLILMALLVTIGPLKLGKKIRERFKKD